VAAAKLPTGAEPTQFSQACGISIVKSAESITCNPGRIQSQDEESSLGSLFRARGRLLMGPKQRLTTPTGGFSPGGSLGDALPPCTALIVTAKTADMLGRIADHPTHRLGDLLPWNRRRFERMPARPCPPGGLIWRRSRR
jgi:hypothetical protein